VESVPNEPIELYAPGVDSGTFDYFKRPSSATTPKPSDLFPSEDDNVLVQGVQGNPALGFFLLRLLRRKTPTL